MKVTYTMNHFKVTLPIWVVSFLLGACSKLGERYGSTHVAVPMEADEGYSSGSAIYTSPPFVWAEDLFQAIKEADIMRVYYLLSALDVDHKNDWEGKIASFAPVDMAICLHIAAGIKDPQAVDIMKLLLNKTGPLLLSKKDYASLLCEKNKLTAFVENHTNYGLWDTNKLQGALSKGLAEKHRSLLLCQNAREETPLLIAAKEGSPEMFKLLLAYTHWYTGLDLTEHKDEKGNDLLDIVLAQPDNCKLASLMQELCNCNTRPASLVSYIMGGSICNTVTSGIYEEINASLVWIHFSGTTKCKAEAVIQAVISDRKKLKYLFKAVHYNHLDRLNLLLDTIARVLGPVDCLKLFTKQCPDSPRGYTLLHTALDKNLLGKEDMHTVKVLTWFLLAALEFILPQCPDSIKKKLELLLSIDETNHLKKDIKSILALLKEHECDTALVDFYTALRIMMLLDSESPPIQQWYLSPLDTSNAINCS